MSIGSTATSNEPSRRPEDLFALDPATVRCPFGVYEHLREEEPVRWVDRFGGWLVTRHEDVVEILRSPDRFSSRLASGPGSVTPLAQRIVDDPDTSDEVKAMARRRIELSRSRVLLFSDPPEHLRQRKLVNKAFTARRVREMEDGVVAVCDELIDAFEDRGQIDFMYEFANALPMRVIADILGVPIEKRDTFKRWSDAFVAGTGSMDLTGGEAEDIVRSVDEFYDYFTEQIADRREHPTDDLLSAVVHARVDDETPLTEDEMLQMLVQFLVAGNETTTSLLGHLLLRLTTDELLMSQVRDDPELVTPLVEEILRLEAPVQGLFRVANQDVTIRGVDIAEGDLIMLGFAAANRDEHAFSDPAKLKLDRSGEGPHVAFGLGEHFCLGAPIARLEARVGVQRLLASLASIELDCAPEDVPFFTSFGQRGMHHLPLRIAPAA